MGFTKFGIKVWERPLMTSDFRVGRGVQNGPKKLDVLGLKRVGM